MLTALLPRIFALSALLLWLLAPAFAAPPTSDELPDNYEESLPLLGDNSSSILSLAEERSLGMKWLESLRGSVPLASDPLMQDYLESLLERLAEKSGLIDRSISPIVILDSSLNAFAAPGGIVGVNTGLFTRARSEGELAAVLSHELAHLSQRHYARRLQSGKLNSIAGIVLILSSLLAILSGGSDTGLAAIYAGTAALQATQLNYSRRDEREADRIGLRTLTRAGYSPDAVAQMFETLRDTYRSSSGRLPEYLLTHPYTEERLSDAKGRAQQLKIQGATGTLDHPMFQIIKIRASMMNTQSLAETALTLKDQLRTASGIARIYNSYGLTMIYQRQNRNEEALALLDSLTENQIPPVLKLPLGLLRAEILLADNQQQEAVSLLRAYRTVWQAYYPLELAYAQALKEAQQYEPAEQILRTLRIFRPEDPLVWQRLSDVQLLSGNALEYHRSSARYQELNGRYRESLQHLREALRLTDEEDQLHEALQDQLQQLLVLLRESRETH